MILNRLDSILVLILKELSYFKLRPLKNKHAPPEIVSLHCDKPLNLSMYAHFSAPSLTQRFDWLRNSRPTFGFPLDLLKAAKDSQLCLQPMGPKLRVTMFQYSQKNIEGITNFFFEIEYEQDIPIKSSKMMYLEQIIYQLNFNLFKKIVEIFYHRTLLMQNRKISKG